MYVNSYLHECHFEQLIYIHLYDMQIDCDGVCLMLVFSFIYNDYKVKVFIKSILLIIIEQTLTRM